LKTDGSVITWGIPYNGGDSSKVKKQLASGVLQVIGNYEAFAALHKDGSVITWGIPFSGGNSKEVQKDFASSA